MDRSANRVDVVDGRVGDDSGMPPAHLDLFGSETTWEIINPAGVAVEKGGPYVNKTLGQKIERKVCLPFGCYSL